MERQSRISSLVHKWYPMEAHGNAISTWTMLFSFVRGGGRADDLFQKTTPPGALLRKALAGLPQFRAPKQSGSEFESHLLHPARNNFTTTSKEKKFFEFSLAHS
ncbi:hypothetical protein TNIN_416291 [Trichonephila inaurata madagascariensis]|uniref:Uncharacterized protein n=1 Tax=Trichonephila inaurata madagascariensis TaxID=2747483 RepID=A0A8X6XD34_9ARAC|nr:hypothetical protein TNIN_416291 [Trichonephila inaurata madagascariensis]